MQWPKWSSCVYGSRVSWNWKTHTRIWCLLIRDYTVATFNCKTAFRISEGCEIRVRKWQLQSIAGRFSRRLATRASKRDGLHSTEVLREQALGSARPIGCPRGNESFMRRLSIVLGFQEAYSDTIPFPLPHPAGNLHPLDLSSNFRRITNWTRDAIICICRKSCKIHTLQQMVSHTKKKRYEDGWKAATTRRRWQILSSNTANWSPIMPFSMQFNSGNYSCKNYSHLYFFYCFYTQWLYLPVASLSLENDFRPKLITGYSSEPWKSEARSLMILFFTSMEENVTGSNLVYACWLKTNTTWKL